MAKEVNNAGKAQVQDEERDVLFGEVSDATRADLTDEELAGMEGDDAADEEAEADADADQGDDAEGEADAGEADAEEADEEADEEGVDAEGEEQAEEEAGEGEEADAGAEAAEAEEAGEEEAEEDEADDLDLTRSIMPDEWKLPADAETKVKDLEQQAADLAQKFDDGELTAAEYRQQSSQINDQRSDLRSQINDAKKSFQKAMTDWSSKTVGRFLREHKQYADNPTMNAMLDAEVRRLQMNTDDPFNPRVLRAAHRNIVKATGMVEKAAAQPAPKKNAKPAEAKGQKKPVVPGKKPQVPPTLARVPADEIDDQSGGRFARLERLSAKDPHAFEEAFAKLSANDRDAYLAGA